MIARLSNMAQSSKSVQVVCIMTLFVVMATASSRCTEVATLNTGLMGSVPEADIRRPEIIRALKLSTADLICLQEVWFEKDVSAILEEVQGWFPHHYSKIHFAEGSLRPSFCEETADSSAVDTPCTVNETQALTPLIIKCAFANGCSHLQGTAQGVCIATKCGDVLKSGVVSEDCISCLTLNAHLSLQEFVKECNTPISVHNRLNSPGLLVLSKKAFNRVNYTSYFPDNKMTLDRGYIEAELDDGKLIVCTHLSSLFSFYVEYDLPFGNYLNQSKAEIRILSETFADKDPIVVGDINTGPQILDSSNPEKNLMGEFPENYDLLISFGYSSPYLEQDGRCTYCRDNPYTGGYPNNVIDQVMVLNTTSYTTADAKRVFDTNVPPLSDHYGVQVRICDSEE